MCAWSMALLIVYWQLSARRGIRHVRPSVYDGEKLIISSMKSKKAVYVPNNSWDFGKKNEEIRDAIVVMIHLPKLFKIVIPNHKYPFQ